MLPYTAAGDVFLPVTEFQTHTVVFIVQDKKTWSIIKIIVIVTIMELMPNFVVWTNEIGVQGISLNGPIRQLFANSYYWLH